MATIQKISPCLWCDGLKDEFGLSWQIVPTVLPELVGDSDPVKAGRAMKALLQMKKLDIGTLKEAYAG
jgi:predicted 3-demethylubiquinone-9 3-methyltransferase (glyoxalase superfamily)